MGTFKIRPTAVLSGGTPLYGNLHQPVAPATYWFTGYEPPNPPPIVGALTTPANSANALLGANVVTTIAGLLTLNQTLRLGFIGNSIYLDGSSTPIAFSGLPSGFTPLTATLIHNYDNFSPQITQPAIGSAHFFLQLGTLTEGAQDSNTLGYGVAPSALSLVNNGCGIRVAISASGSSDQGLIYFEELYISGTYAISSFSWTLPVSTNVKAGDKFTISGTSGVTTGAGGGASARVPSAGIPLSVVSQLHIQYADSSNVVHDIVVLSQDFISQSDSEIVFYFPQFGNFTGIVYLYVTFDTTQDLPTRIDDIIISIGSGTQFSGTVLVGSLTVTFADSSGIYTLIPNKTSDTIYDRTTPGSTKDVNILDPTIEVAFIP